MLRRNWRLIIRLEKASDRKTAPCDSSKKVPITQKRKRKKRKDVLRNEELVFRAFLELESELGKRPTQIQVAAKTGLSRKKVGQYIKQLNL